MVTFRPSSVYPLFEIMANGCISAESISALHSSWQKFLSTAFWIHNVSSGGVGRHEFNGGGVVP